MSNFGPYYNPDRLNFNYNPSYTTGYYGKKLPARQGFGETQGLSLNSLTQSRQQQMDGGANGGGGGASWASGIQAGVAGLQNIMQAKQMGDQANQIETAAPNQEFDYNNRPSYNLGQYAVDTNTIKPQGATFGEVAGSVGSMAMAGLSAGGPIGALVGGAFGAVSSLVGGRRRKRKMNEKKQARRRNLLAGQQRYNQSQQGYNQSRLAQEAYSDEMNTSSRLYNIYNTLT